jgi:hypothetical protein
MYFDPFSANVAEIYRFRTLSLKLLLSCCNVAGIIATVPISLKLLLPWPMSLKLLLSSNVAEIIATVANVAEMTFFFFFFFFFFFVIF